MIRAVERLTGRGWLGRRYDRALEEGDPLGFFGRVLDQLEIRVALPDGHEARVPREGPVLFIANHPFGLVDGLVLCSIAARTRGDFKILLHMGLCRDPRLGSYMLPVDMADDETAKRTNRNTVKQSLHELREGGTVLLFPAGGISTAVGLRGPIIDLEWHPLVAKLFRATRVTVVPVYFAGKNSRLFQTVSQFSPTLRASVLMSEMRRRRRSKVVVRIGEPILWSEADASKTDEEIVRDLREAVYRAGNTAEAP